MAIKKLEFMYPKGSIQSNFDYEAMTALELAAATSNKVDECIDMVNGVEQSAIEATAVVDEMRADQESIIRNLSDVVIPDATHQFVNDKIADGTISGLINEGIFGQINSDMTDMVTNLTALNTLTSGHTTTLLSQIDKTNTMNGQITNLNSTTTTHDQKINQLQSLSADAGTEIYNINQVITNHGNKLNGIDSSILGVNGELSLINQTVTDQRTDINTINGNITGINSSIANAEGEINKNNSRNKSSVLYDAALKDMSIKYNLPKSKKALSSGTFKIAFVGDSIAEGSNNIFKDVWVMKFIDGVKKKFPNVNIQFTNFSLGGRTIDKFLNNSYVATATETDTNFNFMRYWSTAGKSWKKHVLDYEADLIFIAFGMNDTLNTVNPDNAFVEDLQEVITYLSPNNPDFCLVSTILPTQNKTVYNQSEDKTLMIARATQEFAKEKGLALADANRLWRILLYGKDDHVITNKTLTTISTINTEKVYNFEATIKFPTSTLPTAAQACDIVCRITDTFDRITIRFLNTGGSNKVIVYNSRNNMNQANQVAAWDVADTSSITVRLNGSKIQVGDGTIIYLHEKLIESNIDCSGLTNHITSISFTNRKAYSEQPPFTEKELLGEVTNPIGQGVNGNGINHPSPSGHKLAYYNSCLPVLDSLELSTDTEVGSMVGMFVMSMSQANYSMSSMFPLTNAQSKTITLVSGEISGIRALTSAEIALLTVYRYNNGFSFTCNNPTLITDIQNKAITLSFNVV